MTTTLTPAEPVKVPSRRSADLLDGVRRWAGALVGAVVIFSALLLVKGADPIAALGDMVASIFTSASIEQIAIKATPLILAAMAVVLPARTGLANVGGEGQVIIGAVCAAGVGLAFDSMGPVALVAMLVAGAAGGALWAGIAAAMRLTVGVNEAVTTLLLNYVALDVMLYLIYEPWKDPNGSGQPATRPLAVAARLPLIGTTAVHMGLVIALVAAVLVWLVLRGTAFGFRLGVTGGNPEAARRAGLPVKRLLLTAMLLGGALAGLAGVMQLAGVEFKLRPGLTANIGYIAFLAAWLARHKPLPAVGGAVLLAVISIGGDSLQLDSGLPAATVNVLMGLVLLAVLGWASKGTGKRTDALR
ncbi:ABC transporter permease [Sphaerisporangium perillae]|uniref:ABC transporter permease n=1 Tax=Sphaerisporangium perillae TaxID=2935860 RepID=UPI002010539D|nr:ABC transporter permease [Sphaerisporangium perillae]